jgi:hypothetical protein
MTVKGAKAKKISQAETKRQIGNERARADAAEHKANQALAAVEKLSAMVENMTSTAQFKAAAAQAAHDPSAEVARKVLREVDPIDSDLPLPPAANLPPKLAAQIRAMEAGEQLEDDAVNAALDEADDLAPIQARNNPRTIRQGIGTDDEELGQYRERPMKSEGRARDSLAPLRIVDDGAIHQNRHYSKDKLLHEAFMHEYVYIRVAETTDDVQTPMPEAGNGGIMQYFSRGKSEWVRRKFLEPLLRARITRYTQRTVHGDDGVKIIINVPHTTLLYPFEVIQDNDKGKRWLRNILAEGGTN